ncbi:hypothetical protein FHS18_003304 [Paenibacillus phyllosphaerae]|uniref:Pullulanase n=1 Tax=Paenibacillus phyllosphaerae TaxID=274593 RepID=A0A7W5FNE0_9BACL|nr:DUF6509 family protein [Paenibacillus phyllosphaerae]MBB3111236.1 hypothetical protein [Paenibacillus phyllosphaerae]
MLTITSYSVELVKDPFGILPGKRYEFILDLEIPEDDELHSEMGIYVRVVYRSQEENSGIVKYEIRERSSDRYIEMDFEDEELAEIDSFCREHLAEAE